MNVVEFLKHAPHDENWWRRIGWPLQSSSQLEQIFHIHAHPGKGSF